MRYWMLAFVLVLGCVGSQVIPEPDEMDAKGGFLDGEFPQVQGYELISVLRIESDDGLDPERSLVRAATYVGASSFTYTIQTLNYVPDLGADRNLKSKKIGGIDVYYWYWKEIPFVVQSAFNLVWNDNNTLYSVSVKNGTMGFGFVEEVWGAEEVVDFDDYGFLQDIGLLPDPYGPWVIYGASMFERRQYNLATGYYLTPEKNRVDLMVLHGDVDYVIGGIVGDLIDGIGVELGDLVIYEGGVYQDGEHFYRRIYKNGDIGVVASTPIEQKEANEMFINHLIEDGGAAGVE